MSRQVGYWCFMISDSIVGWYLKFSVTNCIPQKYFQYHFKLSYMRCNILGWQQEPPRSHYNRWDCTFWIRHMYKQTYNFNIGTLLMWTWKIVLTNFYSCRLPKLDPTSLTGKWNRLISWLFRSRRLASI